MPALRLTLPLSLLVLGASVAGTAWMSAKTYDWAGPPRLAAAARPAAAAPVALAHAAVRKAHSHAHTQRARLFAAASHPHSASHYEVSARPVRGVAGGSASVLAAPSAPGAPARRPADGMAELVPVAMPATPVPYAAMRGHLSGSLVLRVWVDGSGQVADAQVAASSGDPALDAHALASVRRWRFAVPADKPDGITGELPMRFDEPGEPLARGT